MTTAVRKSLQFIHDDCEFYQHQVDGIRTLARMGNFILADEMGLGKSLQALTVFAIDVERGAAKRCLVVAPITLKWNWQQEIEKHTSFRSVVLHGTPKQRLVQLDEFIGTKAHILIVNYEQVGSHLEDLNGIGFDVAIYDEAHALKNPKAKRTKFCQGIQAKRHFLLTGSPLLNQVDELWSLLYRVDPVNFDNYWKFKARYCVFGGFNNKQIVGIKNEAELREALQSRMVRRLKNEVLGLPEKQYIKVWCGLTPEQKELYREVREEMKLTLPADPDPVEIENGLTKFLRLKQICGTTACFDGMPDKSDKLDIAIDKLGELFENGHKVVVFTQFRGVLHALNERLRAKGMPYIDLHGGIPQSERQERINTWSAHKGPAALTAMLQVASVGLNMTASRHVFFLDKLWVPKLNEQAEDRCHRIGASMTQPVQIYEFITRKTVEERVESLLRRKVKIFNTIVETPDFRKRLYAALAAAEEEEE